MYVENITGDLCQYVQLKIGWSSGTQNTFDHTFGTYDLSVLNGSTNAILVGRSDPLVGNSTTRLVQQPYVEAEAPNAVQGSTCTWDEIFAATQPDYGINP